jgi:hypothetical protein
MRVICPSDPFNGRIPDGAFADEYAALQAAAVPCALLATEEYERGRLRVFPPIGAGEQVLYRGWMLAPDSYAKLVSAIEATGPTPITNAADYLRAHHLPEWHSACEDLTPRTVFLRRDANFVTALVKLEWTAFFVKDYVKSLTTKRGSIARTPAEVAEIVADIEKFRGGIEGGVCVREFERFRPQSEERYFAFRRAAFARDGTEPPPLVCEVAARMNLPFISIDVALREDGVLRLIELGDGQVSDRKRWELEQFVAMLRRYSPAETQR